MKRREIVLLVVLITLAGYAWAFKTLMTRRREDISLFVVAGGGGVDPERIPAALSIIPGIEGYDGMAFYRLALDPLTRKATDFGITLDNPAYRQQRVLYPLIVHVLSLGNEAWVPTLLVVTNLAAVGLLAAAGARLATQFGISPFWGLLIPSYPGLFIAFSRNTSEIVAWAFAVAAIAAFTAKRWRPATALLSCAVLSRETTLLLTLSLAAVYIWRRTLLREPSFPASAFVVPTAIYAAWQGILRMWWGVSGLEAGTIQVAVPFSGYLRVFAEAASRHTAQMRIHYAECVFWAVVVLAVALVFRQSTTWSPWHVAWVAYLALGSILGEDVWSEQISFMRVLTDLFAISGVLLFGATSKARWPVFAGSCCLSYYVMSHLR